MINTIKTTINFLVISMISYRLDALLSDKELVARRKEEYLAKPSKVSIGSECPVW